MTGHDLINCKTLPPGFTDVMQHALRSTAYYDNNPYPFFGFAAWKTEELGPYPTAMPIPRAIVRKSAVWLFGKEITLDFPALSPEVQKAIDAVWLSNQMNLKLVPLAMRGGKEGAVTLKFSYNETNLECPIKIQILSSTSQVKYFRDPHDSDRVLMVRVQYAYKDLLDNNWYWYREEWTSEQEVHYLPIKINDYGLGRNPYVYVGDPIFPGIDTTAQWIVDENNTKINKFGLIPFQEIYNLTVDEIYGLGDFMGLERLFDRINLTYHLMDKDNQKSIDPHIAYIDLEPEDGDALDRSGPNAVEILRTRETVDGESPPTGKIEVIESQGKMREWVARYANDCKEILFDATGSVFPRQEDVTNKGSLTQSVLIQMYKPLMELTGEKQKTYGEGGIVPFLKKMILGLANLGVKPFVTVKAISSIGDDKLHCTVGWFTQFKRTDDEEFAGFDRFDREYLGGYISEETALDKINELEEIRLTDEQKAERIAKMKENYANNQQQQINKPTGGHPSGNDPGGNEDGSKSKQTKSTKRNQGSGSDGSRPQKRGNRVKDAT